MPLDHYISQVYLRNFYSPIHDRLNAVRKADLKYFTPPAEDVCRLEEGNTNKYLIEPRAIEEFLQGIEPKYNKVLARLRQGEVGPEDVYVLAGLVSYFLVCSPAGTRLRAEPMKPILAETARRLDRLGKIPPAPAALGGETITQLLDSGSVGIGVDEKFPQAMGISGIHDHIFRFGNFSWDFLINPYPSLSFLASDYPLALEESGQPFILNKLVPLAPDLALRIRPDRSPPPSTMDFTFPKFRPSFNKLRRSALGEINMRIVRCAETTVFYRDEDPATLDFIKRHAGFRIESHTERIPRGKGMLLLSSERIVRISATIAGPADMIRLGGEAFIHDETPNIFDMHSPVPPAQPPPPSELRKNIRAESRPDEAEPMGSSLDS